CFMIDRDARNNVEIEEIRTRDREIFDETFIVLDKHEFENYFLEPALWKQVHDKFRAFMELFEIPEISEKDIYTEIKSFADSTKDQILVKTLTHYNSMSLSSLQREITNPQIPVTPAEYMAY